MQTVLARTAGEHEERGFVAPRLVRCAMHPAGRHLRCPRVQEYGGSRWWFYRRDTVIYGGCCRKLQGIEVAVKKYDKSKVSSTKLRAIKREVAMMLYLARKRYGHVYKEYWNVSPW